MISHEDTKAQGKGIAHVVIRFFVSLCETPISICCFNLRGRCLSLRQAPPPLSGLAEVVQGPYFHKRRADFAAIPAKSQSVVSIVRACRIHS